MTICPVHLEPVIANRIDAGKLEGTGRVTLLRPPRDPTEQIGLPATAGAGAGAPELLERVIAFVLIVPDDRELGTDYIVEEWFHSVVAFPWFILHAFGSHSGSLATNLEMPTFKLTIEYDGGRYSGWQTQSNTSKTVQGHLISAARQLFHEADVGGAGRTDAGVHAAAQVAHLRIRKAANPRELARQMNDLLPHDIHVLDVQPASENFHARHDAESRIYMYQISRRRTAFGKEFVWWIKDQLNVSSMSEAARFIPGMHDFSSFSDQRGTAESTDVLVEAVEIGEEGDLILIRIRASHFLWKMVRKLIAALVEVGRGNLSPRQFGQMIEAPQEPFRPTAPPSGLFLEAVTYAGEKFDRPLKPIIAVQTPPVKASAARQWDKQKKR